MALNGRIHQWRTRFYAGPPWLEPPVWARGRGYRSPTVLMGAWLAAWYLRMFSVPGRMMVAVLSLMLFYGLTIRTPIRLFSFALLGVLFADLVMGFFLRPRLKILRTMPERAREDSPVRVDYQVSNRRRWPAFGLFLDAVHPHSQFQPVGEPASLDALPGHQTVSVSTVMRTSGRGRYRIPMPVAVSSFPFGIFRWSCVSGEPQSLLVHPAFEPLQGLTLPVGQRYQRESGSLIAKVGEALEFHGCREFRTGDNPRHIHWPSSARAQALVVREFQEEHLCRVALITDTWMPSRPWHQWRPWAKPDSAPAFEAALSLTVAVADFLARGDQVVDLFAAGPEIYHFHAGRGRARFGQLLDIISGLEPNREEPLTRLAPSILEELAEIGAAVVMLLEWDELRAHLIQQLRDHGVSLKLVLVAATAPADLPTEIIHLHPDEIRSGSVRQL